MSAPVPRCRPPQRTYKTYYMNSAHWDAYQPRPDDIVISTPAKVGTTWTQRIVASLVFQSAALPQPVLTISPWLDATVFPLAEALRVLERQKHRRFLKTHLPMDALPIHPEVSYLVVGRDLRDAAFSTHNHALHTNRNLPICEPATGEDVHTPDPPHVSPDIHTYWRDYFTKSPFPWESNGWPFNSPTHHLASWWGSRDEPNVLFLHYQDMLDDLDREMRRISGFLEIPVDEAVWPTLVKACEFTEMKAGKAAILGDFNIPHFEFFHKGRSGQWRQVIGEDELALHDAALAPLPADLRQWLAHEDLASLG